MGWLTLTHTQRWHAHHLTVGHGHLYQGRFKSFVVEESDALFTVCRYVERNALRAGLVEQAEQWRWGSAWQRGGGSSPVLLTEWPVEQPPDWMTWVNAPQTESELAALRQSVIKGQPFGAPSWVEHLVRRWSLGSTLRLRGRPRKK